MNSSIQRVFLGWDGPMLPRVVDWLRGRYQQTSSWDMGGVRLTIPSARAGRRLLELLADASAGTLLVPPLVLTPGQLPEHLYTPTQPIADELTAILIRIQTLQAAPPELLKQVIWNPPQDRGGENWRAWMALAQELDQLHRELAGEMVHLHQVAGRLEKALPDFVESGRWDALSQLQQSYETALEQAGFMDRQAARRQAMERNCCACAGPVVLVATIDMPALVREMLLRLQTEVSALIFAPDTEADAFGPIGCVETAHWQKRLIPLSADHIHLVDRPRDQAWEVLRHLQHLPSPADLPYTEPGAATSASAWTMDQITIGLGEETLGSKIERTLGLAGIPAHLATGTPLARTRPGLFLQAWARWLSASRFDDLAALLRHPDVETYLQQTLPQAQQGWRDWQTWLDEYLTSHLQGRAGAHWLGDEARVERLKNVHDAIAGLAPPDALKDKPLPVWAIAIAQALTNLYARAPEGETPSSRAELLDTLTQVGQLLRELTELPPGAAHTPRLTLAQAVGLLLQKLADWECPPADGEPAVDVVGWLELALDDAPVLLVAGMNEGSVPASVNADAYLPNQTRRILGLVDNDRRYARDALILTALCHSRPVVELIAGRRGAEDDPLLPSRLLLACPPAERTARLELFYGRKGSAASAPLLLTPGQDRFLLPLPTPPAEPITRLPVTAFGDYLCCPYRFYLKHVLKLRALADPQPEMDAMQFGMLAHDVLQAFGQSRLTAETDADQVRHFLWKQMDRLLVERFGLNPPAAIAIQGHLLKERFAALALWQSRRVEEGWRLEARHIERELQATITLDGQPFTISGRIDRIDRHAHTGQYQLLDYKTSDRGMKPDELHRHAGEWVNLQLPLYALLVEPLGITDPGLGYVRLPKKLEEVGLALASWESADLDNARDVMTNIIRAIRRHIFWPPKEPVPDEFAGVCQDEALDRAWRIRRSGEAEVMHE